MATQAIQQDDAQIQPTGPLSADQLDRLTRRLAEKAEHYDRSGEFPRASFDYLASEGLIGLTVPRELGGRGARPPRRSA